MPTVTHKAVKGIAVCCLIVQPPHIPNLPPVHTSPGSRTQPLLHQSVLAGTFKRSHNPAFQGEKTLNTSETQREVQCQQFLSCHCTTHLDLNPHYFFYISLSLFLAAETDSSFWFYFLLIAPNALLFHPHYGIAITKSFEAPVLSQWQVWLSFTIKMSLS